MITNWLPNTPDRVRCDTLPAGSSYSEVPQPTLSGWGQDRSVTYIQARFSLIRGGLWRSHRFSLGWLLEFHPLKTKSSSGPDWKLESSTVFIVAEHGFAPYESAQQTKPQSTYLYLSI